MTSVRVIGLAVLCTLLVSGCAKKAPQVVRADPPAVPEAPPPPPPPAPAPEVTTSAPAALTEEELFARKTLEELNAERPLADVYFDLDQFSIRDDARAALQRNAEWMRRWTSTRIMIEGHCDARGTGEYNLALGERRAVAVRDYLVNLGIASDRVLTVSRGEETPVCFDEVESCWQQNRRGHSIVTAK